MERETEYLLATALNCAKRNDHIMEKIDNSQQNSKCR